MWFRARHDARYMLRLLSMQHQRPEWCVYKLLPQLCPVLFPVHAASCSLGRRRALVSPKCFGIRPWFSHQHQHTLAAISDVLRDSTGGRPSALALNTPLCCSSPSATTTQFSAHPAMLC